MFLRPFRASREFRSFRAPRVGAAAALLAAGWLALPASAQFALPSSSGTTLPAAMPGTALPGTTAAGDRSSVPYAPSSGASPIGPVGPSGATGQLGQANRPPIRATPAAPGAMATPGAPAAPAAAAGTGTGAGARRGTEASPLNLPAAAASGAAVTASLATGARINLQQLTDAVVQNNPALLSAQRLRNTAQAAILSAGAYPNPRLDYAGGDQSARRVGGVPGNLSTYGVTQLIENPWLRSARVDTARAGARVTDFQAAVARNELVAQVRLRAYDLLLRQAEAAASAEAFSLLEQVNSRVRARVESGEAPRYELIKADAETINARSLQQSGLLQAQQAGLTLNRLAAGALPPQWSLDAALSDAPRPAPDMMALRQQMLARNPELLALQAEVERARNQLDLAEANRLPGLEVKLSQSREPDIRQNMLGVSVQIPLFDRRTGPIAEAGSELERARGRLEGRQAELEQQLLSAQTALQMAQLRTEALSTGAVRDAEAALRVADAAWRFGERGILDVLDAQRVLRAVRADLLTSRFQVQAARTELDFLSGRWADETPPLPSAALQRGGLQ